MTKGWKIGEINEKTQGLDQEIQHLNNNHPI